MKKITYLSVMFILGMNLLQAKPVTPTTAKNVAISFYKQHSAKVPQTVTLAYTETSASGEALYYIFNVNTNDGFVIITADDAAHPIIAYSTESQFVIPKGRTNIGYWMNSRKKEIISIKAANLQATSAITREWAGDFTKANAASKTSNHAGTTSTMSVSPLVQTTWNQSPYYNELCPSTDSTIHDSISITGCNATAMSQIMRYWSYPTTGTGSSSYCDCGGTSDMRNYGTLSANYGATTYNWANMPLNISTYNIDVATINYHCGVSVGMNYSPQLSSSYVIAAGAPGGLSAQNSYTAYFGYAPTISAYQRTSYPSSTVNYSDAQWLTFIETDLDAGRPVQYAGTDSVNGGHTWVCDGYDASDNLHMNWGWGGFCNGYYSINDLQTTNGTPADNFEKYHEILVGIQPPNPAVAAFTPPASICATQLTAFTDASAGPPTSWVWSVNPTTGVTISSSTVKNPNITFTNPGTYTITEAVLNGIGGDNTSRVVHVSSCSSLVCDTATHIGNTDNLLLYTANTSSTCAGGYYFGNNCYNFLGLAEAFTTTDFPAGDLQVNGAIILFYRNASGLGTNGYTTDTATTLSMVNGTNPGAAAATSTTIMFSDIVTTTNVSNIDYAGNPSYVYTSLLPYVVTFASPVALTSNFFLTLTLPAANSGDTVAVYAGIANHNPTNTAWLNYNGTWRQYSSFGGAKYAMAIMPIVACVTNTTGIKQVTSNNEQVSIYPNPSNGLFNLTISRAPSGSFDNGKTNSIEILNMLGECVHRQIATSATCQIDLSNLAKGIYYATITDSNNNRTVKKIIIE